MGFSGIIFSGVFFILMTIAALTSSISMLEGVVAFGIDNHRMKRKKSTYLFCGIILLISFVLIFNMDLLFGFTITLTSKYSLPLLGTAFCIFVGWVINRNDLLEEIRKGYPNADESFFFKLWPIFMRVVCPILILAIFIHSIV